MRSRDGPSAESKWLLSAQLSSQCLPPRLRSTADKRMEEPGDREGCCDALASGHCTHALTVTMVTYTRSSQQAQWTFQKAALTGLISYKKREGGHKQEMGPCLRCPEDWEGEVRGRYDQDKSFVCITSSENIWKYFIRNARCIIVLAFFFFECRDVENITHESHFFLKVSVDILSHIFTELAVFQIIDLPVLTSTSCFHCVFFLFAFWLCS